MSIIKPYFGTLTMAKMAALLDYDLFQVVAILNYVGGYMIERLVNSKSSTQTATYCGKAGAGSCSTVRHTGASALKDQSCGLVR